MRWSSAEMEGRLDAVGWGLLFLVSGILLVVPSAPQGSWLITVGLILLGVTAVKWALGVRSSVFIAIVGAIGLLTGLGEMAGFDVPWLSVLLVLSGVALIAAQFTRRVSV